MDDIRSRAAEALEEAADAFESGRLTWIQGSLGWGQYGTACARGALFHALMGNQRGLGLHPAHNPNRYIATVAERAMGFTDYLPSTGALGSLPGWNDARGRTMQDVIDRMKEGAKRLRNGETD